MKAMAIGYPAGKPMSEKDLQLRLALSAAVVCAVLAAATASGAQRAEPPAFGMEARSAPILVQSISTFRTPGPDIGQASRHHVAAALGEARSRSVIDRHQGER